MREMREMTEIKEKMVDRLPTEIQRIIYEFDPTYREYFSSSILSHFSKFQAQQLATSFFYGKSQVFKSHFRFLERGVWYTVEFEELSYHKYRLKCWNESKGTCSIYYYDMVISVMD